MKIVVLGGYGVFGSRLARLLIRDGHDVTIAGRNVRKAQALANVLGCTAMTVDHRADPVAVFDTSPDVVVDAAGPFQAYHHDPYIIPRLCLEYDADYLDLSDDAAFTVGLGALDNDARKRNRRLLSGVSTVPGISSAVAADLCIGLDEILLIDTAILPGNRAPRGKSVMASIIGQLGQTARVWRGGIWRDQRCWSDTRRIRLSSDLVRSARFIEVPDILIFPDFFRAKSVMFRAGMELRLLNAAMYGVAALRRYWPFEVTSRCATFFWGLANLFLPFGTDRGGMRVVVVGRKGATMIRREWRLIAVAGEGPYIPAVCARAVIRRVAQVPPGARPCLAEVSRTDVENAMTDLAVSTHMDEHPSPALFQSVLRDRWAQLPPEIHKLHNVHDVESFSGSAEVVRGASIMARMIAWFFKFPPASTKCPVTVTKTRTDTGEIWQRNFNGKIFRSFCIASPLAYRFRERFWPFQYEMDVVVQDCSIQLPVRRGWFLGIPLPRFLLPRSDSREYVADGVFHFDVGLSAPLGGGLIVRYRGSLHPDDK
tara:strand:- start:58729 stop:60348 length:1620 start_codon:yes stop_codon:yes gene_type:complete